MLRSVFKSRCSGVTRVSPFGRLRIAAYLAIVISLRRLAYLPAQMPWRKRALESTRESHALLRSRHTRKPFLGIVQPRIKVGLIFDSVSNVLAQSRAHPSLGIGATEARPSIALVHPTP